jgi:hypothetical protein
MVAVISAFPVVKEQHCDISVWEEGLITFVLVIGAGTGTFLGAESLTATAGSENSHCASTFSWYSDSLSGSLLVGRQ